MSIQKITPGVPALNGPLRSAAFQNTLVDIVDWWRQNGLGKGRASNRSSTPTDIIKVKNNSGSDRAAGEVLEVGTHLLTDIDRRNLWFNADTVSHPIGRSYCVLKRPVPSGEIDEAHVSGVCVARVNIQATTDRYAFVESSSNVLKSGIAGQFRLLGPLTSTGERDVAVVFDGTPRMCFMASGSASGSNTMDMSSYSTHVDEGGLISVSGTDLTVIANLAANERRFKIEWQVNVGATWPMSGSVYTEGKVMLNGATLGDTSHEFTSVPATTTILHAHTNFAIRYLQTGDVLKVRGVCRSGGNTQTAQGRIAISSVF